MRRASRNVPCGLFRLRQDRFVAGCFGHSDVFLLRVLGPAFGKVGDCSSGAAGVGFGFWAVVLAVVVVTCWNGADVATLRSFGQVSACRDGTNCLLVGEHGVVVVRLQAHGHLLSRRLAGAVGR